MTNLKKVMALLLALVLCMGLAVNAAYTDVDNGLDSAEAIYYLTALGVLKGEGDTFRPADTLTRAEAAKILALTLTGKPEAGFANYAYASAFGDVNDPDGTGLAHWALQFINFGVSYYGAGYIKGTSATTYSPEQTVTFGEFVTFIVRAVMLGYNTTEDIAKIEAGYPYSFINIADNMGLLYGVNLLANDPISRENAAIILYNLLWANEALWAKFDILTANGVVYGTENYYDDGFYIYDDDDYNDYYYFDYEGYDDKALINEFVTVYYNDDDEALLVIPRSSSVVKTSQVSKIEYKDDYYLITFEDKSTLKWTDDYIPYAWYLGIDFGDYLDDIAVDEWLETIKFVDFENDGLYDDAVVLDFTCTFMVDTAFKSGEEKAWTDLGIPFDFLAGLASLNSDECDAKLKFDDVISGVSELKKNTFYDFVIDATWSDGAFVPTIKASESVVETGIIIAIAGYKVTLNNGNTYDFSNWGSFAVLGTEVEVTLGVTGNIVNVAKVEEAEVAAPAAKYAAFYEYSILDTETGLFGGSTTYRYFRALTDDNEVVTFKVDVSKPVYAQLVGNDGIFGAVSDDAALMELKNVEIASYTLKDGNLASVESYEINGGCPTAYYTASTKMILNQKNINGAMLIAKTNGASVAYVRAESDMDKPFKPSMAKFYIGDDIPDLADCDMRGDFNSDSKLVFGIFTTKEVPSSVDTTAALVIAKETISKYDAEAKKFYYEYSVVINGTTTTIASAPAKTLGADPANMTAKTVYVVTFENGNVVSAVVSVGTNYKIAEIGEGYIIDDASTIIVTDGLTITDNTGKAVDTLAKNGTLTIYERVISATESEMIAIYTKP